MVLSLCRCLCGCSNDCVRFYCLCMGSCVLLAQFFECILEAVLKFRLKNHTQLDWRQPISSRNVTWSTVGLLSNWNFFIWMGIWWETVECFLLGFESNESQCFKSVSSTFSQNLHLERPSSLRSSNQESPILFFKLWTWTHPFRMSHQTNWSCAQTECHWKAHIVFLIGKISENCEIRRFNFGCFVGISEKFIEG